MIKAVLLDLGGVLTVNRDDNLGPKENLKVSPEIWHKAGLGLIDDEVAFLEIAENYAVDSTTIKEWLFSKRKPNQAVLELLTKLKPGIKKAIISNSVKTVFDTFIRQYDLKDKFDVMVISAYEQIKKPDSEIFLRACQKLGVKPEECLFVDNDQEHIEAAQRLRIQGLLFTNAQDLEDQLTSYSLLTKSAYF